MRGGLQRLLFSASAATAGLDGLDTKIERHDHCIDGHEGLIQTPGDDKDGKDDGENNRHQRFNGQQICQPLPQKLLHIYSSPSIELSQLKNCFFDVGFLEAKLMKKISGNGTN